MTKRIGSSRRKTRDYMTQPASARGKFPLHGLTQKFAAGDCVVLSAEPSVHKGLYFRRFHGKTAKVMAKRGRCYEVSVVDGRKEKTLIVNPVHMVRV
ncbi:50S ribosomal protein L21e [Candidatus Woesearchaeota archaeon]|nr:50S ribosomal protein L21e [Candidatus Woesearchaeota archaeon]